MKPRKSTLEIREYILNQIDQSNHDVTALTGKKFGLSRQAVNNHVRSLIHDGVVIASGQTRKRKYELVGLTEDLMHVPLKGLAEDALWRASVSGLMPKMRKNISHIWYYGFTEMVNNAIDHSGGNTVGVCVKTTAISTEMIITDDGVGIFRKIKDALKLEHEQYAVLELAKGKLTTDPENHTGEGVFFTSRVFDKFFIFSGGVVYSHFFDDEDDWSTLMENSADGTTVFMSIQNNSSRDLRRVFDSFTSRDDAFTFNRTAVPVRMVCQGTEQLVSRSQAKRLLARFDCFQTVVLDFSGIDDIGRAFCDEIFRVFPLTHPDIQLSAIHMKPRVKRLVNAVQKSSKGDR